MLVLVVGAKGGVGTTSLARHLVQGMEGAVGLDLAGGQLAAQLERKTWSLAALAFATGTRRQSAVDRIIKQCITLLWTPECRLAQNDVWSIVRAVADRTPVVADGGIEPLPEMADLADATVIVGSDNPVARYHENRLEQRFPDAVVVTLDLAQSRHESRDAAPELSEQLFGKG
jgi:hypothetical protein